MKLREPSLQSGEPAASETRGSFASAVAAGAVALTAVSAQAATITVNSLADNNTIGDGQCTFREALNNANVNADVTGGDCVAGSGTDTINLTALAGTITLSSAALPVKDSATITGPGASTLTIDAATNSRVFYIYNNAAAINVTISGLTATNGRGSAGANIFSRGEILTLNGVTVSNGIGTGPGGGVANVGGTLTLQASTVSGNTSQATNGGGGIYSVGGAMTIANSVITGNSQTALAGRGGALSILSTTQPTVISNTQITNNSSANKGGAVALKTTAAGGTLAIDHSVITGNIANNRGGAFFLYRNAGAITIDDTQIQNNSTTQNRGGGLFLYNTNANVTITDSTISGNTAPSVAGNGAGLFLYKQAAGVTITLERSTISGNTANRSGGGIFFYKGSGTLAIIDSTIANNSAGTSGGGLFDRGPFGGTAALRIEESTISGNSAVTSGGNLNVTVVPATITNSIIANGTAPSGPDALTGGSNVTMNYSLLESTSGATFAGSNNLTGVDPNLGPLQDNGGPTFTMRPNAGSPVLDAGDPGFTPPPSSDQRGLARVYNGRIDMGALEQGAQSAISFSASGTTVSEGAGSATVTVNRSSGEGTASVNYSTSNGSAQAGADYTATSGTLTFAAGDFTPKTITIPILEDTIAEANETFSVNLSVPSNATLTSPSSATVTITDNDPTPSLSISGVSQAEGNAGTTAFNFVVTLSNPSASTVTVNYATANGSAIAGSDYAAQSGTLTFAPGTTVQTIPVAVLGDTTNEPNETFTVVLTSPANATIGSGTATGTINNDDAAPALSIGDVSQAEGNSGTTNFSFPVTLSAPSAQTVTVNYATVSGSAVAPGDFTATSGTLTFAPGVTSQSVVVSVVGDTTNETNETFTVQLSAPSNAVIADDSGLGTIVNDDAVPGISIGDVSQAEGNGGTTSFTFDVTLSAASGQTVTVDYATSNGSAIAGSDYAAASGTLTFAPGVTSQQVTVLVNGDTTNEPNETFNVTLSTPVNATLVDSTAVGTIVNDDGAPALSIGDIAQAEGNSGTTSFSFAVMLSAPSEQTVTVDYVTTNGSATAGSDYGATSGTLTFAPGVTAQTINVPVTGDTTNEADETFTVTLSNPANAVVADGSATGTIVNDDGVPSLSIAGASQNEGDSGTTNMTFNVTLSAASEQTVTVNYTTVNGSAIAGSDYTATSGIVTFAPGVTSQTVNVPILGDTTDEIDETFSVALSGASNATIGTTSATGTIVDDDAVPVVSINDVSQAEGNSGSTNFAFTVSLSQASERPVTVSYATSDGSAIAGSDYTATSGTVTFAPGVTSQTINVPVSGDTTKESSETFTVALSSPTNATLGTATGTGTIVDDDNAPVLAINNVSQAEGDSGSTSFMFTVTLSQPSGETVTVNYATANGTAVAGEDYGATSGTLTFAPGVTSQTITVPVTGDAVSEPDETFTVTLSSATNAPIGTTTGTGTIVNDDSAPALSIGDAARLEGNSGTSNLTFTVTLSAPSEETITVQYTTANGTAVAGSDYDATSGTLTFAPGVTSQTISVPIIGDVASEPDETFTVILSAPVNAAIADSSATGTIENDDAAYVPSVSINDVSTAEGNFGTRPVTFTVTLDAATTQPVSVDYHTTDISAQQGSDYAAASGSLLFAPGTTSRTVTVNVLGDEMIEPTETFALDLANPAGATIADPRGIATITNDDSATPQPRISISDATVTEGNDGLTDATITVTLSGRSDSVVTVDYATADGTAQSGSDYATSSGTIVFAPGTTSRTIHVPVLGDRNDEENETFFVRLSRPGNADLVDREATVTIIDDDEAPAGSTRSYIAIAGSTPGAGGSYFRTILQLHNPSDAPASGQVIFHPAGGGAVAVTPYALAPHQTVEIEDAALSNGIGSADLVGLTGPAPLAVIRIVSTSECGTVGLSSQSIDPSRDALTAPARGVLLVPVDLGNSRFNVGIRAIATDATVRLGLYDASGNLKKQFDRTFAADALLHTSAADLFGMTVNANDSIRIEVLTGSVIAYGATTDNGSQDPALQLAKPL